MRVLMSGGGTAGHVYPALAVADRLVAARDEVTYVGTSGGIEARLAPLAGLPFRPLAAAGFDRARPWTLVTSSMRIAASTLTAWRWFGAERPEVVMGFGGYVSIPVGLAAVLRGIPLVVAEQNSVPGMANRFLSRWAAAVAVTYEESAAGFAHPQRVRHTGNPVRAEVLSASAERGREALGVPEGALMLLVFGGSRGARHLNSALVAMRDRLMAMPNLYVVLVAGPLEFEAVSAALEAAGGSEGGRYRVVSYLDDMGDALKASDLVIARAGATSIAEITVLGLPAVLVPFPFATEDHQTKNAAAMVAHGAAELYADADLDDERFSDIVCALLADDERRASMAAASRTLGRPDAAERVVATAREASATAPRRAPQ